MKTRLIAGGAILGAAAAAAVVWGGSITPPPGAVGPTMKTLTEVEPRIAVNSLPGDATAVHIISQVGSYYLTGDVVGVAGKDGIRITAMGTVSIDLGGFALRGVPGSGHGALSLPCPQEWAVFFHNGFISGWGGDGIHAESGNFLRARDLVVSSNGGDGIEISDSAILDNVALDENAGAAVNILANARGVELHSVSISGSGTALHDAGIGTVLRDVTVNSRLPDGNTLVTLGTQAVVNGLVVNVADGSFSGPIVDAWASGIALSGLTVNASGVAAETMLTTGANLAGRWSAPSPNTPTSLTSENSTFSTAIVDIDGDGGSFSGSITASGSSSGPRMLRVAGDYCNVQFDLVGNGLTAGAFPIGAEISGSFNDMESRGCIGVPSNPKPFWLPSGATGNVIKDLYVACPGSAAYIDEGLSNTVENAVLEVTDANIASAAKLGQGAIVRVMSLNAKNSTCSGALLDASAADVSIGSLELKANAVTAPSLLTAGARFALPEIHQYLAVNCNIATAIFNVVGDDVVLRGLQLSPAGTTTAPVALRVGGNRCSFFDIFAIVAGEPIGIDILGTSCTLAGTVIKGVPSGGTGIRIQAGANGNQIDGCRIAGSGAGPFTAISVAGNNNLVINNRINALLGGTAINNTGANNVVAPVAGAGNIATLTNPATNFAH